MVKTLLLGLLFFATSATQAQNYKEPAVTNAEWSKPYPSFKVAGNLYYVGTRELACYLITTSKGNILINTGLAASAAVIKSNIERLGFKLSDIKILLTTQAHFDHVGAMAAIKRITGAQLMVNEAEAAVLADGGSSDYEMGTQGASFEPVKAERLLRDGDTIALGGTVITHLHHPGHTKGSSSFILKTNDQQRSYTVLIANLPSIITDRNFANIAAYPNIAADYAFTLKAMKNLQFDIWVASHASQFKLHRKRKYGDGYRPSAFIDRTGYQQAINDLQKQYDQHLKKQ